MGQCTRGDAISDTFVLLGGCSVEISISPLILLMDKLTLPHLGRQPFSVMESLKRQREAACFPQLSMLLKCVLSELPRFWIAVSFFKMPHSSVKALGKVCSVYKGSHTFKGLLSTFPMPVASAQPNFNWCSTFPAAILLSPQSWCAIHFMDGPWIACLWEMAAH